MKKRIQSQDKPQTKLRVSSRRARLMKLFAEGKSVRAAAMVLRKEGYRGASDANVGFDLQAMSREAPAKVEDARNQAELELRALKKFIADADDMDSSETVSSLLAVHDRVARLLGLDAPTKSIGVKVDASIDPATLVGYRKFVHVTSNMDAGTLEKVYEYAARLNTPPAMRVIGPPSNSELWDDETKQLTDGAE